MIGHGDGDGIRRRRDAEAQSKAFACIDGHKIACRGRERLKLCLNGLNCGATVVTLKVENKSVVYTLVSAGSREM